MSKKLYTIYINPIEKKDGINYRQIMFSSNTINKKMLKKYGTESPYVRSCLLYGLIKNGFKNGASKKDNFENWIDGIIPIRFSATMEDIEDSIF